MNKIILFLIVIIIGAALSSDVYLPSPGKKQVTALDCTSQAIQVCGTDNSKCLKDFVNNCEKTHGVVVKKEEHKKHHTYKTSIIVKESEEDFSDDDDVQRICITDSNCNCKTQSKSKCEGSEDEGCYNKNLKACQTRCQKSRKCYRMDCKRAGHKRCKNNAELECNIKHANSKAKIKSCIAENNECCQRYEKATCNRAVRVYQYRTVCNEESQRKCKGFTNDNEKCSCVSQTRHSCLVKKVETHKQNIRKVFDCEESAKLICSEKKCGTDYTNCLAREKSVCEPVCHKESRNACGGQANGPCYTESRKKCINKWKRDYCKTRAAIKCAGKSECSELEECKSQVPSCITGEVSCNDNNKCTEDICHPTQGCINKPINCDDKNACTTESCDPLLGCVYKTKKCDDGKVCTRDSCNPATGECKFVFDKNICHVCKGGPCQNDNDCLDWEKSQHLSRSCQRAVCNKENGSCSAIKKVGCAEDCQKTCKPNHACDSAKCVANKAGTFECVHSAKVCNDHKSCTTDSCDKTVGCVHKLDKTICPNHPICEKDSDCLTWETTENLKNKCQKAKCDRHKGICVKAISSKTCDEDECNKNCKARTPCETARCAKNSEGKSFCLRNVVVCNDGVGCTVDSCHPTLGCQFKYRESEKCPRGGQCRHTDDCKSYEAAHNLKDQCLKAVCDTKLGACVRQPIDSECETKRRKCLTTCVSTNKCEVAKCIKDKTTGTFSCSRSARTCDDGVSCTVDSCHKHLGCVSTYTPNDTTCPPNAACVRDSDCLRWGFTQKLGKQCKKAVCNRTTGACSVVPKEKSCVSKSDCELTCQTKNACQTSSCVLNDDGNHVCKRVQTVTCDDKNKCTLDTCDSKTGKCVFTKLSTPECVVEKCKIQKDCDAYALRLKLDEQCRTAVCDDKGECNSIATSDPSCESKRKCRKECIAKNNCEVAQCQRDEGGFYVCKRSASKDASCSTKVCPIECVAKNPCESAKCIIANDGTASCARVVNTCNDGKSCTVDSCDIKTGKCINTYTPSSTCTPGGYCEKNLDCAKWGVDNKLDRCQTPVCDAQTGSCKAIPNDLTCTPSVCQTKCPPKNACEVSVCAFGTDSKFTCEYKRKSCDDKNSCTRDSCDEVKGCQFTFDKTLPGCDTPICKEKVDCAKWSTDNKLSDICQEAVCDSKTFTCRAVLINNKECNPILGECKRTCNPRNKCETAECIVDPTTQKAKCLRGAIKCDDGNECTSDVCDATNGCKFTYVVSEKCEKQCKDNVDCTEFGLVKQASLSCQVPYCDKQTTTCKLRADDNKNCKPIDQECKLTCVKKDQCDNARCVRVEGTNKYNCVHESVVCNDGKSCTQDSCDAKKGCVFTFKESKTCKKACDKDLDCNAWGESEKLSDKCYKPKCSKKTGSCIAVKGVQTEKCKTTDVCKATSDCPQGKFGTVCCSEQGVKKCCDHECESDLDCVPKNKNQWGYCVKSESGKQVCKPKDKCKGNEDCDDKNPCTRDVCLTEYGFCKNTPRCQDNSLCTHDICAPSQDGKSYTCTNPKKSCTEIKELLDKDFSKLTPKEKTQWLGNCSNIEGCVSCVVNAQCDDNNGCTEDSCENQRCISRPIDNKWCDPNLQGQAITVQGYFPKFTRL